VERVGEAQRWASSSNGRNREREREKCKRNRKEMDPNELCIRASLCLLGPQAHT